MQFTCTLLQPRFAVKNTLSVPVLVAQRGYQSRGDAAAGRVRLLPPNKVSLM
jgi:hypothetical protein